MYEGPIQTLIDELGRLPGVGPKGAQRIAFHILATDAADVQRLADALREASALSVASRAASTAWPRSRSAMTRGHASPSRPSASASTPLARSSPRTSSLACSLERSNRMKVELRPSAGAPAAAPGASACVTASRRGACLVTVR